MIGAVACGPGAARRWLLALVLVPLLAAAEPALLEEAQRLAGEGRHAAALDAVERYLAGSPDDPHGRFLEGVLLVETGRESEAIDAFDRLVRDHPELPEPWNNLAVLYAARGDYERARDALQQAINTHPAYAIAHENLGDIYARLASIAYDRALQLDDDNSAARSKLALVRELFSGTGAAAATPATTVASAAPAEAEGPAAAAVTPPPPPGQPLPGPVSAVRDAVLDWARAWSTQDVPGYLASYGRGFQPPGGVPRASWESERRERLLAPAFIELGLDDVDVEMRGVDRARVVFTQSYRSDTYADRVRKVLGMAREPGGWKIVSEVSD